MKLTTILAIGCAAALAQQAAMADYFDEDQFVNATTGGGTPVPVNSNFNFISGSGDLPGLSLLGFNPATETVTGIDLVIQLINGGVGQQAIVKLDGGVVLNAFFSGSTLFGGTLSPADEAALIAAAQFDGIVDYEISAGPGSQFEVLRTRMDIQTTAKSAVPDAGATLAMLGFAVAGLGVARRKLNR